MKPYVTTTLYKKDSDVCDHLDGSIEALRIFDYSPLANSLKSKEGQRQIINEYAIKVKPGKIDKMLVNSCKVFNNGGMGDPIVQRFNASQECPTIRPHDVISRIHKYTPIMWGNLRGNKGLLDALDYLDKDYFHIDHAYFGRGHDHKNYRVSVSSRFAGPSQSILSDRLGKLQFRYFKDKVFLKPWRKTGDHILICPPSRTSRIHRDSIDWLDIITTNLSRYTDRDVVIKEKSDDSKSAFDNAWAIITEESNVAIDAYNHGIPVFSMKPDVYTICCGNVGLENIENPKVGDRELLFNWLAYNQFTLDEIESGEALSILSDIYG